MSARPSDRRRILAAAVLVATAGVVVPSATAIADPGAHDRAASTGTVAEVRKAIAPFRSVQAALDAGYVPVSGCETSPDGGMGIHYMNPRYAVPGPVDPATPAILLYAPDSDGTLQLLGAEYWQPEVGQPVPHLAGQPFDGPMDGHGPDMPRHYDLHVWTEVANPSGVFAPWNPRVSC